MKVLLLSFTMQTDVFPLGLAYIQSYAQAFHPDIEFQRKEFLLSSRASYETNKNTELAALSYILLEKPDLIAFSCYIWNANATQEFAHTIKTILPNTKILIGGVEITKEMLTEDIDFAVQGEGEIALKELLDFLKGERKIEDVHNLITKSTENKQIYIQDLDSIPFPYLTKEKQEYKVIRMETSRGCAFNCSFCHYAQPPLRFFSLEYIKKGVDILFEKYTFSYLTFLDANFNAKKERMFAILDYIEEKSKGKKIPIHVELRPELIDADMAQRLRKYAFPISCELGLQSTDAEVLKAVNRPTDLKKVQEALKALEENKVHYKIDLMYGLPKDNFYKFLSSVRFILRNTTQKKIVAHHFMQLNNTTEKETTRIKKTQSSMVMETGTQNILQLHLTKLFLDQLNEELKIRTK